MDSPQFRRNSVFVRYAKLELQLRKVTFSRNTYTLVRRSSNSAALGKSNVLRRDVYAGHEFGAEYDCIERERERRYNETFSTKQISMVARLNDFRRNLNKWIKKQTEQADLENFIKLVLKKNFFYLKI